MNDSDSFFGLDLQVNDPRLNGAIIDCTGGPITPEIIDEAFRLMRDTPPPPPCGTKGNPHLVHPRPIGRRTYCIQCGYQGVRVSATDWRGLNEEEIAADVLAMHVALLFYRVERRKKSLIRALRLKAKG
jgi:hypothetical protein